MPTMLLHSVNYQAPLSESDTTPAILARQIPAGQCYSTVLLLAELLMASQSFVINGNPSTITLGAAKPAYTNGMWSLLWATSVLLAQPAPPQTVLHHRSNMQRQACQQDTPCAGHPLSPGWDDASRSCPGLPHKSEGADLKGWI